MSPVATFVLGLLITAASSCAVVWYLNDPLQGILVDLCGTETRAAFWRAFSNVTIALTPVMFAMHYRPAGSDTPVVFEIGAQLEYALAGLLLSVVILGFVLSRFILKQPTPALRTSA
jgi:hypothetical protein